ncbi:MAG: DUF4259 domain-containing protein [Bacteroidetes bacterium]|nr:DUF4259 domain-containing protein [Bacteroidota bacterium]
MGAWEMTNFGNDTAMDWMFDFEKDPTLTLLEETIDSVFEDDYLDSDIASEALAALEIVAAVRGRRASDLPEDVTTDQLAAIAGKITPSFIDDCRKALDRIVDPEDNELYELWEEAGHGEDWLNIENDLRERLG